MDSIYNNETNRQCNVNANPAPTFKTSNHSIVNTSKQLYTYEEMLSDISKLAKIYNVSVSSIGKSVLLRDIPVLKIGSGTKKIIIVGSTHGREYMTTQLIMRQLKFYLENSFVRYNGKPISTWLKSCSLFYVPMLNPDGVSISQHGILSIKDHDLKEQIKLMSNGLPFEKWKANARGIDINRNFNAGWEKILPTKPGYEGCRGPYYHSEPETKAIVNYINSNNFDALISYHSAGSVIYWHYSGRGHYASAVALSELTGYPLDVPDSSADHGGLKDWFILRHGKPGVTIEIGDGESPLPIYQFDNIFMANKFVPFCMVQNI